MQWRELGFVTEGGEFMPLARNSGFFSLNCEDFVCGQSEREELLNGRSLLSVPQSRDSSLHHLLLQLEHTIHQGLGSWWAPWHVNINWNQSVTSSNNRVRIMVVATTVGARSHRDDPSWVWHLVIHLPQRRSHLVGDSAGDNHDIGLTRRGSENNTQSILIVSWGGDVHHLDGTASQTESDRPE